MYMFVLYILFYVIVFVVNFAVKNILKFFFQIVVDIRRLVP